MKKLVYRTFIKDDNGKWSIPNYDIYSDGSVVVPKIVINRPESSLEKQFRLSETEFRNKLLRWDKEAIEKGDMGILPIEYINCPLTCPEEDEEAFYTLCLLLDDVPPFKGRRIKYFGEGRPWIPNPEYDPDPYLIIN